MPTSHPYYYIHNTIEENMLTIYNSHSLLDKMILLHDD